MDRYKLRQLKKEENKKEELRLIQELKIIDEKFMNMALLQAKKAYDIVEIPIGAIIVDSNNNIISRAYNKRNKLKKTTAHAEILAIEKACKKIGDWRLDGCSMYVTLEPCPMCAGAIMQSRIKRLIIGARSLKSGSCGSIIDILSNRAFNHRVDIEWNIMSEKSEKLLKEFFEDLRTSRVSKI